MYRAQPRRARPESGDEALDRILLVRGVVSIDQVLVEALAVAGEVKLGFEPDALGLAGRRRTARSAGLDPTRRMRAAMVENLKIGGLG